MAAPPQTPLLKLKFSAGRTNERRGNYDATTTTTTTTATTTTTKTTTPHPPPPTREKYCDPRLLIACLGAINRSATSSRRLPINCTA